MLSNHRPAVTRLTWLLALLTLTTVVGCKTLMEHKDPFEKRPTEFSCGEPLPPVKR